METLRRIRLFQARTLIVGGSKLADVAEQTGFWDEHHLGKLFKKAMGVSPGEYRRMQQKLSSH
jgi:two-component system response regulator YesN